MLKETPQYNLMKNEESYFIDDFLFNKQKKCSKTLSKINRLPFGSKRREKLIGKQIIIEDNVWINT